MSALASPVHGRPRTVLSTFTASTGPSECTGSPVNGDRSWGGEGDGDGVAGWAGAGVAAACLTRAPPLDTSMPPTTRLATTKATPLV
jgi:hypothetical protein